MASDLWKTFEEEKDMQLKDISNSWAKQQGFPVINVFIVNYIPLYYKIIISVNISGKGTPVRREAYSKYNSRNIFADR